MSSGHLFKRFTELPLHGLKAWSDNVPFKMDALGLVTLLGADQVSTAIGSLQRRRYTGALPRLAAFVLAGDRFTSIEPGFTFYHVTNGYMSTAMAGWFTRWLTCQRINNSTTVFEWKRRQTAPDLWRTRIIAMAISCSLVMPLIVCTALMGDWYGVANAGAIVVSIAARLYILGQKRQARDRCIVDRYGDEKQICIITRPDGKMVTMRASPSIFLGIMRPSHVHHPHFYGLAQQAAWVALGTHLLVLGMCTLVTQIYTVVLLVSSTVAISSTTDWTADTQHKKTTSREHEERESEIVTIPFNDNWNVVKTSPPRYREHMELVDKRMFAFARLGLDESQEARLKHWQLAPRMEDSVDWWWVYRSLRDESAAARCQDRDTRSPPSGNGVALQAMRPSVQSPDNPSTLDPNSDTCNPPSGNGIALQAMRPSIQSPNNSSALNQNSDTCNSPATNGITLQAMRPSVQSPNNSSTLNLATPLGFV